MSPPSRSPALVCALGVLGAHNLIQNFVLREAGYVTGNLAVSAVIARIGRSSGASWDEMGLGRPELEASARVGGIAAAVAAAGAIAAMAHPRTRAFLRDDQAQITSSGEMARRALIRFPLGTAMFEEISFRGVLPALMPGGTWRADALAAGVFALWHLIPTARVQSGNPTSRGRPVRHRIAGVLAGSTAAGVAGFGLSRLRRRTGSLVAPWMAHASVNSIAFLAGVTAQHIND